MAAAYGLIGGLLLLLVAVFVRLLVLKSRNKAGSKTPAGIATDNLAGARSSLIPKAVETRRAGDCSHGVRPMRVRRSSPKAAEMPAEPTLAADHLGAALVPASAHEAQTGTVSLVPDDVSEQATAPEADRPIEDEPVKRLSELSRLRANGMLTESEFDQLKSAIIASVSRNTVQSP